MNYKRGSIGLFFRGDPNLQSWYLLNGNCLDFSGYNRYGTASNLSYAPVNNNIAGLFNGTNSKITTSNYFSSGITALTLMAWVTLDSDGSGLREICSKGSTVFDFGVGWTTNYKAQIYVHNGSWRGSGESTTNLNDGKEHLVIGRYDGSYLSIWVDAKIENSLAVTGTLTSGSTAVYIGSGAGTEVNWWKGKIREVGMFSRALSPQEIVQYYRWATSPRPKLRFYTPSIYTLAVSVGTFTLTGIATTFTKALNMVVSAGSYVLTGIDVLLGRIYTILCNTGSYVLIGIDTAFTKALNFVLSAGSYTLTGIETLLTKALNLTADVGHFILTGMSITFKGAGNWLWTFITKHSADFTNETKHSATFNNLTKHSSTWTNEDKS